MNLLCQRDLAKFILKIGKGIFNTLEQGRLLVIGIVLKLVLVIMPFQQIKKV